MNDWTLCIAVKTSLGTLKTQTVFSESLAEMVQPIKLRKLKVKQHLVGKYLDWNHFSSLGLCRKK